MIIEASADLRCHSETPCEAVRAIHVRVLRTSAELELTFRLAGNISSISLLPPDETNLVELWRHTCFEVFVAIEGRPAYHEFNFAPSGEWRARAFRAYRDPALLANQFSSPIVSANATNEWLELEARVVLSDLSPIHSRSPLRLGLSAVVEPLKGGLSFWALHHSGAKPDFHRQEAFALRLERP
jgi:hypothetical protein